MSKCIKITEEQYRFLVEGIEYQNNGDGTLDMTINTDKTDKANIGGNSVDTRVFGTRRDILQGDGTANKRNRNLTQKYNAQKASIEFYQNVIDFVKNGRQGELKVPENLDSVTYTAVQKWFNEGHSDNRIIAAATKAINRIQADGEITFNKYERINAQTQNDDDVAFRYNMGTVPHTNVKYIALFTMSDFNFSDAIKHGKLRQNGNTDELLGITKDERQKDGRQLANIGITYDKGKISEPNVAANFSLDNVPDGHYKQQYGYKGKGGYSSVTAFLDKSVMYAAAVLKEQQFTPDFIIAAPSSSKFNDYYCQNLSNKLGKQYVPDFFQRNVVNVRFDNNRDPQEMTKQGFSQKDILEFETQVKGVAYGEIAHIIAQPVREMLSQYSQYFSNIRTKKNSRQFVDPNVVTDCIVIHAYNTIIPALSNGKNETAEFLARNFMNSTLKLQRTFDTQYVIAQAADIINRRIGQQVFGDVLNKMQTLTEQYVQILSERGYKLQFNTRRFKITHFKKQFRPFLHNVYVVADAQTNRNGELFKRYQNAKFLIFDEDINSGATLKCAIDALNEKLPSGNEQNILCLVNAYSASGF